MAGALPRKQGLTGAVRQTRRGCQALPPGKEKGLTAPSSLQEETQGSSEEAGIEVHDGPYAQEGAVPAAACACIAWGTEQRCWLQVTQRHSPLPISAPPCSPQRLDRHLRATLGIRKMWWTTASRCTSPLLPAQLYWMCDHSAVRRKPCALGYKLVLPMYLRHARVPLGKSAVQVIGIYLLVYTPSYLHGFQHRTASVMLG